MSAAEVAVAAVVVAGLLGLWFAARPVPYEAIMWRHDGRVEHRQVCPHRDLESKRLCARRRGHRGHHRVEQVQPPTLAMMRS